MISKFILGTTFHHFSHSAKMITAGHTQWSWI